MAATTRTSILRGRFSPTRRTSFLNSESFAREFIKNDPKQLGLILFDHATADWRDVVQHKVDVPTAIFTGEYSDSLAAQKWLQSVIPGSTLFVYTAAEQGDHFLAFQKSTEVHDGPASVSAALKPERRANAAPLG